MKEKITTLKALLAVREAERRYLQLRLEDKFELDEGEQHMNILVCGGTGCTAGDSAVLMTRLEEKLAAEGLADQVKVVKTGCFGFCQKGPIVAVYPDRIYYTHVKPEDADRIVEEHVMGGHIVKELQMFDTDRKTGERVYDIDKIGFYEKQQRIALRNCGRINPENIYEYIGIDGYEALYHVLTEKNPQDVIDIVKASGLRGRGGAGFPTGMKWQFEKDQPGDEKYVICNADEGDPGAFMDRSILEGDPHAILEGMAIMAYAVGALRVMFTSVPSIRSPSTDCASRSVKPRSSACSEITSSAQASTLILRSVSARARSSAARRPRSSPPSWASAACRHRSRPSRQYPAYGRSRPRSTMLRQLPISHRSS